MKATMTSPYVIREIARKIEQILGLNLGIPMNAEISNVPTVCGEEKEGTFTIHYECGWHVTGRALVGIYESLNGDFQAVRLMCLCFRRPYHRGNRRRGTVEGPLPSSTMMKLETIGASMNFTGEKFTSEKFVLRLTEDQIGDVRHFAERFPEVKLG